MTVKWRQSDKGNILSWGRVDEEGFEQSDNKVLELRLSEDQSDDSEVKPKGTTPLREV